MRAVIIEDEPNNAKLLSKYLSIYAEDIEICSIASTVKEGISNIKEFKPELLFLDVELPDGTGFDVLKETASYSYQVVFCTGHSHYALKAIKLSALDYLMKPIDAHELTEAIKKIRHSKNGEKQNTLTNFIQDRKVTETERTITLKVQDGSHFVKLKHIILLKGDNNYTEFFIANREHPIVVSSHLKEFEEMLPIAFFFRSHRSYIINLLHLTYWDKKEGDILHMSKDLSAPLSRRKRNDLLEKI